jgi:hypothetical protein
VPQKVQSGNSELSAVFIDFSNAVDFLLNLEFKELIIGGESYVQEVKYEAIKNNVYEYTTKTRKSSAVNSYEIFKADSQEIK